MFKLTRGLVILLLFSFLVSSCAKKEYPVFSTLPEKAQTEKEVTIVYNAAKTSLKEAKDVKAVVYFYDADVIDTKSFEMKKEDELWKVKVTPLKDAKGMLVKFTSGELVDNNDAKGYNIFLHDQKGNVLSGAHAGFANCLVSWGYYAGLDRDFDLAIKEYENEFKESKEIATKYLPSYFRVLSRVYKDASKDKILPILNKIDSLENKSEEDIRLLVGYYSRLGENEKSEKYVNILKEKFPNSDYFEASDINKVYRAANSKARVKALNAFMKKHPQSKSIDNMINFTAYKMIGEVSPKELVKFYKKYYDKLDAYRFYSAVTKNLEKKKSIKYLKELAELGLKRAEEGLKAPVSDKPKHLTEEEWKKQSEETKAYLLYAVASVNLKANELNDAEKNISEAVKLTDEKDSDINELYAEILIKNGKHQDALKKLESFIQKGNYTAKMKDYLKEAYVKVNGSDKDFDKYVSKFEDMAKKELEEEIKKNWKDIVAPDFTLKDINGKDVKFSDYKGKVVVLDFWATWCGPCKTSFPSMKKAVEKYKNDKDVVFLFVNTWSNAKDKVKDAKDFIEKHKYPFHVACDVENKVVEKYKVQGVPTKFFIDKQGKIRYESVGFEGEDKLLLEMDVLISMLKK